MKRRYFISFLALFIIGMMFSYIVNFNFFSKIIIDSYDSESNLIKSVIELSEDENIYKYNIEMADSKTILPFLIFDDNKLIYKSSEINNLEELSQLNNYNDINKTDFKNYNKKTSVLNNGDIIIFLEKTPIIKSSLIDVFPNLLVYIIAGIIISLIIAKYNYQSTIDKLVGNLIDYKEGKFKIDIDDDSYPIFNVINEQSQNISANQNIVNIQNDTIHAIIYNMAEGMILLNQDMEILVLNDSSLKLLDIDYEGSNFQGVNIKSLVRNSKLVEIIDDALNGNNLNYSTDLIIKEKIITAILNPVEYNEDNVGYVLFLVDETKQKSLEKQRSEFSANVSHELKTPLTSINGYAEMIMSGIAKESDIKKFAQVIYNEGNHLLSMIDDIIKISKLDEEQEGYDFEVLNITDSINDVLDVLRFKAEDYNVNLIYNEKRDLKYCADKRLFSELMLNLVDNAIKYNKPGGYVKIETSELPSGLVIKVSDTGIGISEDDKARVFERFYTVDRSHNKKDSSGLGLAIVKHIVKIFDGKVELNSKVGEGSTFTLTLPLKKG